MSKASFILACQTAAQVVQAEYVPEIIGHQKIFRNKTGLVEVSVLQFPDKIPPGWYPELDTRHQLIFASHMALRPKPARSLMPVNVWQIGDNAESSKHPVQTMPEWIRFRELFSGNFDMALLQDARGGTTLRVVLPVHDVLVVFCVRHVALM